MTKLDIATLLVQSAKREHAFGTHSCEMCGRFVWCNVYLQEEEAKCWSSSVPRSGEEARSHAESSAAVLVVINLSSNAVLLSTRGVVPCIMLTVFRPTHVGMACTKNAQSHQLSRKEPQQTLLDAVRELDEHPGPCRKAAA